MARKDKVGDVYVYYNDKTSIAKHWLDDKDHKEEAEELFDEAEKDVVGDTFRVDGRAYVLVYRHSNNGYRNFALVYVGLN